MIFTGLIGIYFSKLFAVIVLFAEDIYRGVRYVFNQIGGKSSSTSLPGDAISRSEFMSKTALVAASVPFGTMALWNYFWCA